MARLGFFPSKEKGRKLLGYLSLLFSQNGSVKATLSIMPLLIFMQVFPTRRLDLRMRRLKKGGQRKERIW